MDTEHRFRIRADAREVQNLGRTFRRTTRDLERDLKSVTARQVELYREIKKTEQGTAAYKRLREELRAVGEQGRSVASILAQVSRQFDQARQKRQSFAAGLSQGLGVAQYMPAEPGMRQRMAGAMVGGAVRRGIGAALQPGVGAISSLLPGPLSAAFNQAYGHYQQAASLDQARLQAAGLFGPAQSVANPARAGLARAVSARRRAFVDAYRTTGAYPADAADALSAARKQLSETPETVRRPGAPGLMTGAGFGFGATQTLQMFQQFATTRGRRGMAGFQESLAAQLFGVDMGTSGGLARMRGAGGGGAGTAGLAQLLQTAMADGLEGSQLSEYLRTLVQLGQRAEQQGVHIDERSFGTMATTLSAVGFRGLQAQRVAGGLQGAAMAAGRRGVQGPMDLLLARAAGFNPAGGPRSYAQSQLQLMQGLTPEMMQGLLGTITRGAGAMGGGAQQQLLLVRALGRMGVDIGPEQAQSLIQGFQGGQLGPEAQRIVAASQAKARGAGGRRGLVAEAQRMAGEAAPISVRRAGIEAKQIETGQRLATMFGTLENASATAVGSLKSFQSELQAVANGMMTVAEGLVKATKKIEDLVSKIPGGAIRGIMDNIRGGRSAPVGVNQ